MSNKIPQQVRAAEIGIWPMRHGTIKEGAIDLMDKYLPAGDIGKFIYSVAGGGVLYEGVDMGIYWNPSVPANTWTPLLFRRILSTGDDWQEVTRTTAVGDYYYAGGI